MNFIVVKDKQTKEIYPYSTKNDRKTIENRYGKQNCKVFTGVDAEKNAKEYLEGLNKNKKNSAQVFIKLLNKYEKQGIHLLNITTTDGYEYIINTFPFYIWTSNFYPYNLYCEGDNTNQRLVYHMSCYKAAEKNCSIPEFSKIDHEISKFISNLKKECEFYDDIFNREKIVKFLQQFLQDKFNDCYMKVLSNINILDNFIFIDKVYRTYSITDESLELYKENLSLNISNISKIEPLNFSYKHQITNEYLLEAINREENHS